MKRTYDLNAASQLVPLLNVITREIAERSHAVRALSRRLRALREQDADVTEILDLQAELANHKRELRHAREELTSLGCMVDDGRPLRVMIPGEDGSFESGFALDIGDEAVQEQAA